ncbi:MAG TPA: hypothetical protein VLS45_10595, partial [Methylomicrobium sp.]|nr:hypothetical protein [Methylomicrobium sp.]
GVPIKRMEFESPWGHKRTCPLACFCLTYDRLSHLRDDIQSPRDLRERFEIRIYQRNTALKTDFVSFSPLNWHFQANWRSSLIITR